MDREKYKIGKFRVFHTYSILRILETQKKFIDGDFLTDLLHFDT